jgi:UDP-3-O-[3-hydroxymyristoyl] glucosamine N-acyltransferase
VIGQGAKIDNLVQVGHNNRLGKHVIVTGMVGFSGSVTVGDYAVFGGRASMTDHITIGKGARIGLASVVTKSLPDGAVVLGYPARPADEMKRQMAALARLPEFIKKHLRKSKSS